MGIAQRRFTWELRWWRKYLWRKNKLFTSEMNPAEMKRSEVIHKATDSNDRCLPTTKKISDSLSIFLIFPSVLWHCWLGDRKGIRPVKSLVLICWWWRFDWSFSRLFIAQVVTATSIIPTESRMESCWYRLAEVHLEKNGRQNGERERERERERETETETETETE